MAWVKDPRTGLEVWVRAPKLPAPAVSEPGALEQAWEAVNVPLTTRAAHALGLPSITEAATEEAEEATRATSIPEPAKELLIEGKVLPQTVGLIEGLASPLNLAFAGLGAGAQALRGAAGAAMSAKELSRAAKLARLAGLARAGEAGLSVPVAAEGVRNVVAGETPGEKLMGALELAGGGVGLAHGLGGAVRGAAEGSLAAEGARAVEAEATARAVGRPLTRQRFQNWLLEQGVPGNELTGKSATQLRQMIMERGGDPTKLTPVEELGPVEGETLAPPPAATPRVNVKIGTRVGGPGGRTGTIITVDPTVLAREGQVSVLWDEGGVGTMGVDKLVPTEVPQPGPAPRGRGLPKVRKAAGKSTAQPAPAGATPDPEIIETLAPTPEAEPVEPTAAPKPWQELQTAWNPVERPFRVTWMKTPSSIGMYGGRTGVSIVKTYRTAAEAQAAAAQGLPSGFKSVSIDQLITPEGYQTGHAKWVPVESAAPGAPTKATSARLAWHEELGTVQVLVTKGDEALVLPERGRQRLVKRGTLKDIPPEALEPGIVDVEGIAPEVGGKVVLDPEEQALYGIEDRRARADAPSEDLDEQTVGSLVREGTPWPASTTDPLDTHKKSLLSGLKLAVQAGKMTAQEASEAYVTGLARLERQALVGKEWLEPGPTIDGEKYEIKVNSSQFSKQDADVFRWIGSGPVGQRLIRLINGMTGQLNQYAGRVLAEVPGMTAAEATGLASSPVRGLLRKLNVFGLNNHMQYLEGGGFNIDPWSLAQYVDEEMSVRWGSDRLFKHLPDDLKTRVQHARQMPINTLPDALRQEVKAALWLARLRQTVIHEPIHNVPSAAHTDAGAVNTILRSRPGRVVPDRFDVLFKNILKVPEVWASPEYRAMQSPNLRRELVEMYETFRTSADGSPPGTPPPPPPPPGEPPRPPAPIPVGPLSPEDELKVKLRQLFARQRIGRVEQNMKNVALHAQQARILKSFREKVISGEMTATEAQLKQMEALEGLATQFSKVEAPEFLPAEVETVQQVLAKAPWTADVFARMRAARAFERALRGEQLQEAEIKLLSGFFPRTVAGYEPGVFRAIVERLQKLHGSLRAIVTSWDLSAAGRQGLLLTVSHPALAAKAFRAQLRALVSETNFKNIEATILNNPMRDLQVAAGLHISEPGSRVLATGMGVGEEFFENATYAERVPGVRASERAYITYLNKMRSEVFNKVAYEMMRKGMTIENNPQEFVDLARAVNAMSGRGRIEAMFVSPASPIGRGLGLTEAMEAGAKYGEPAVPLLNIGFFAPRFMASRLAILRDLPLLYTNYSKPARQLLMRDVGLTIGAGMSALVFAKAMGANVELDPRSSDFGKVRIGKTRYDPWGGFQPWVRFWAQMTTGQRKPIRAGRRGLEPVTRLETLYRFGEQKLSPSFGLAADVLRGKRFTGEQLQFLQDEFPWAGRDVWSRMSPLIFQDVWDVAQQGDIEQLLLSVPASALGASVQTHVDRRRTRP